MYTSLSCDVYYIENNLRLKQCLTGYFIIQVLHFENDLRLVTGVYNILLSLLTQQNSNEARGIVFQFHVKQKKNWKKKKEKDKRMNQCFALTENRTAEFLTMSSKALNIENRNDDKQTEHNNSKDRT